MPISRYRLGRRRRHCPPGAGKRGHLPLWLEALEDRTLLSVQPMLLAQVNQGTASSDPGGIVVAGSNDFFVADDGVHGSELWKTDGTATGTVLVKDINPGRADSSIRYLTNVNGTLFFTADNGAHGLQLWKSDGTGAGTVMVKDISPASGNSFLYGVTNANGTLFFEVFNGVSGSQVWTSDGTNSGTNLIMNFPGNTSSSGFPPLQTSIGGTFFFAANDGTNGDELWKSDGTVAGTVMVQDINPGAAGSYPYNLTNVNGTLFFSAGDGTHGRELWKSDGTPAGTVMVKDINPGPGSSVERHLTNVNGTLFFSALDGVHGQELWKSDGTDAGTVLVKDINPNNSNPYGGNSYVDDITNVNGIAFFEADDVTNGSELWKSDGTTAGTVLVKDINPGSASSSPHYLTNVNGTLFFDADDGVHGRELWTSDGTEAGTVLFKDFNPGIRESQAGVVGYINGTIFIAANDGFHGSELWTSDGTPAGTVLLLDINRTGAASSPREFTAINGITFFSADDGVHGDELWKTDGTTAGTVLVKDIDPGNDSSYPYYLTKAGGTLFFIANTTQLWKSDGTAAGTTELADFSSAFPNGPIYDLTAVNDTLFFEANDVTHGPELWKSDGTVAGTVMVKDINPGAADSRGFYLTNVNGTLFFEATDGVNGTELWKSDGTDAGTVMVKDINPGSGDSNPHYLTNVNGTLFFAADDGSNGVELWKSDGTDAGTVLVKDINPGSARSSPAYLANVNGTLFFGADDGTGGEQLWKSDGTEAGTVLVKNIDPALGHSSINKLTNANGTLFFSAFDTTNGQELWKSDGTDAGTVLVKDINPGSADSDPGGRGTYPAVMTNLNGTLFFSANDGAHGDELWQSDGTAAGTFMVMDINPGTLSSAPFALVNANNTLFFAADDGTHGEQPWIFQPDHFSLSASPSTTAGASFNVTVTALDEFDHVLTGYTGTVHFTSSNPRAILPANYTFTSADAGVHVFSATLKTAGSQSITATDTANASIFGSQSGIVVSPAAPYKLAIARFPYKPTAGVPGSFRVTAQDKYGNTTPSFTDTVTFSSSDSQAVLPANYTFISADGGVHNFIATLKTAGSQSITVQDLTNSAIVSSTQSNILMQPAATSQLQVSGFPSSVTAGTSHNFTVTAQDPYSNTTPAYIGTVMFTSSDNQATLPANYSFTSGDAGTHTFSATLNTQGTQSITATDTVNAGITGMESGISVVSIQPTAGIMGPVANASGSDGVPGQQLVYTLSASESGLSTDTMYSYSVKWGDGSVQTVSGTSGTQVTHTFVSPVSSAVSLTATDPDGHDSVPASTPISITTLAMETDPYNPSQTALYVGGTLGNDSIAITPATTTGGVKVGMNFVNYGNFFPTGHVVVYSQSGNDIIKTAAQTLSGMLTYVNVPVLFFAGNGNDILNVSGSSANNVLVGGGGTDRLIGGQGQDILISGAGQATLQAGAGQPPQAGGVGDILIGGTTPYDNNAAALAAILAEWTRTDIGYSARIAHLNGNMSGGMNGICFLNSSTVHGNGLADNLYGGPGLDWFFAGMMDVIFNKTSGEVVTPI